MGITDYAQKQLREIVYAELPAAGTEVKQNEPYGTVESVKAVSDLISAVSGTIEEVNEEVQSKPETPKRRPIHQRMATHSKTGKSASRIAQPNGFQQSS